MKYFLLLCCFLYGCSSFGTPFTPEFDRGPNTLKQYIYVDTVEQVVTLCGSSPHKVTLGCAYIPSTPDGVCTMIILNGSKDWVKPHEEAHCRYGRYHP